MTQRRHQPGRREQLDRSKFVGVEAQPFALRRRQQVRDNAVGTGGGAAHRTRVAGDEDGGSSWHVGHGEIMPAGCHRVLGATSAASDRKEDIAGDDVATRSAHVGDDRLIVGDDHHGPGSIERTHFGTQHVVGGDPLR